MFKNNLKHHRLNRSKIDSNGLLLLRWRINKNQHRDDQEDDIRRLTTATKQTKNNSFKEILVAKIDDYMDEAFATNDAEKRQKYREAIRQME